MTMKVSEDQSPTRRSFSLILLHRAPERDGPLARRAVVSQDTQLRQVSDDD